jgi:FMN phosphatase YigB (HAD superfamily)
VSPGIRGVVFDVGYTLLDETRRWREWADWLGVREAELFDSLRTVIAEGRHHTEALKRVRHGFDPRMERNARTKAGWPDDEFLPADLYPDVAPCLQRLKAAGYRLGAAGNMREDTEGFLQATGLPFDIIGSSQRWGVDKPGPMFFARVIESMGLQAEQLAYVGDRLDNDVGPSAAAGMCAVYLQRGLWAEVQSDRPEAALAVAVIDSLDELPMALPGFGRESGSRKE